MRRWWVVPRSSLARVAVVATVLILAIQLGVVTLENSPALLVGVGSVVKSGTGISVNVSLTSHRFTPLPATVSLLPISYAPEPRPAFVFSDSSSAAQFGTLSDVQATYSRVQVLLGQLGSPTSISLVDAATLPAVLGANADGILVVSEYGVLPASVLSNTTDLIRPWLGEGGTLIWAGGPLGYYTEGVPGSPSTVTAELRWQGQSELLGFPLTDPPEHQSPNATPAEGPLLGSIDTPLGNALGIEYTGTAFGANVTEVSSHGGVSMGFETPPNASGASPRTSLAYVPVGHGGLFYFGGGIWTQDHQNFPEAGLRLSLDIGNLLSSPFVPSPGPSVSRTLNLSAFQTTSVHLALDDRGSATGLLVRSAIAGVIHEQYTAQLDSGPTVLRAPSGLGSGTSIGSPKFAALPEPSRARVGLGHGNGTPDE